MRTTALLKNEFIELAAPQPTVHLQDIPAPQPPPVAIFLQYTTPIQVPSNRWHSQTNNLMVLVSEERVKGLLRKNALTEANLHAAATIVKAQEAIVKAAEELAAEDKRLVRKRLASESANRIPEFNELTVLREDGISGTIAMSKVQVGHAKDAYVHVASVARNAGRIVLLICLFSLAIWAISGFVMIHPIIATISMIGAVGFYLMGSMAKKV